MAVPLPHAITERKILVVEGRDDQAGFKALQLADGLGGIDIRHTEGVGNLRTYLTALTQSSGFSRVESLGIVRDSDGDPRAAFARVQSALRAANLTAPAAPLSVEGIAPQVGVMLLPDAASTGEFEDLLLRSVLGTPPDRCVDKFFKCLDDAGLGIASERAKGKVYAHIAASRKPRLRAGEAVGPVFPVAHAAFSEARRFLRML